MTLLDKERAKEAGKRSGEARRRKARERLTADRTGVDPGNTSRGATTGWDIVGHHKKEGKTPVAEGI